MIIDPKTFTFGASERRILELALDAFARQSRIAARARRTDRSVDAHETNVAIAEDLITTLQGEK